MVPSEDVEEERGLEASDTVGDEMEDDPVSADDDAERDEGAGLCAGPDPLKPLPPPPPLPFEGEEWTEKWPLALVFVVILSLGCIPPTSPLACPPALAVPCPDDEECADGEECPDEPERGEGFVEETEREEGLGLGLGRGRGG